MPSLIPTYAARHIHRGLGEYLATSFSLAEKTTAASLREFLSDPDDFTGLDEAVNALSDTLLSHLAYEEDQLVEPLARVGFYPGQA